MIQKSTRPASIQVLSIRMKFNNWECLSFWRQIFHCLDKWQSSEELIFLNVLWSMLYMQPKINEKGIGKRSKLMLQCFKKAEIWHELCVYSPLMLWFAAAEAGAKSQSSFAIRMLHTRVFFTQLNSASTLFLHRKYIYWYWPRLLIHPYGFGFNGLVSH